MTTKLLQSVKCEVHVYVMTYTSAVSDTL